MTAKSKGLDIGIDWGFANSQKSRVGINESFSGWQPLGYTAEISVWASTICNHIQDLNEGTEWTDARFPNDAKVERKVRCTSKKKPNR